jgi:hypothetical protein
MSTVKSKKLQVGTDATATNNFTIYQPATPDGTLRVGVGNADSPTEVGRFTSAGYQATNIPAFSAYKSSDQSLSAAVFTKITFDTELHDNQSSYDSSRFTVPSNQDGLYLIGFNLVYSDATNRRCQGRIYKNGSSIVSTESYANVSGQDPNCTTTFLVPLVAGDYIEIYGYAGAITIIRSQQNETFFWGYKLA